MRTGLSLLLITLHFFLFGGIFCPPTMYLHCDDDISNLNLTMKPTLLGAHAHFPPKYTDVLFTNSCNVGYVIRTWYGDGNGNNVLDEGEPSCQQTIFLQEINQPITINFPSDKTYTCKQEIKLELPTLQGGPCDILGISYTDQEFTISEDACYKILRKFVVVNWCTYNPNDPNWNGQGIWQDIQIIKVIDKELPTLESCVDKEYAVGANCLAEVTLTNNAYDSGTCPSSTLLWSAEIDLWADGTFDYYYGYDKSGIFKISEKQSSEEVKIKLPALISEGKHKVLWKVKDGCGNTKSCLQNFITQDKKAPTPYCLNYVTITIDGSSSVKTIMDAKKCSSESFDNCTKKEDLAFAFSQNILDNKLELDCDDIGHRVLNLYVFDKSGNYDYCKFDIVVMDNETCPNTLNINGKMLSLASESLPIVEVKVMRGEIELHKSLSQSDGNITLTNVSMHSHSSFNFKCYNASEDNVDIFDFIALQNHLLGKEKLENRFLFAANIDRNLKVNAYDLKLLKDIILNGYESKNDAYHFVHESKIDDKRLRHAITTHGFDEFKGNLNYYAIQLGDLVFNTEGRSNKNISCKLIPRVEADHIVYDYIASEDIEFDGLIINSNEHITSDYIVFEKGQNKIISFNPISIKKDMILFSSVRNDLQEKVVFYDNENKSKVGLKIDLSEDFSVLPNPSHDYIILDAAANQIFALFDENGKALPINVISSNHWNSVIDVTYLNHGIYFLKLKGGKTLKFSRM